MNMLQAKQTKSVGSSVLKKPEAVAVTTGINPTTLADCETWCESLKICIPWLPPCELQNTTKNNNDTMLMLEPMRVWGLENRQISESMGQSNNQSNKFVLL